MTELESPVAPESFTANIGATELIKRRSDYLGKVLNILGFKGEVEKGIIEFKSYELSFVESDGQIRSSDDKLTVLIVRGSPVASVLETIGEDGYVDFSASYLTPQSTLGLKQM